MNRGWFSVGAIACVAALGAACASGEDSGGREGTPNVDGMPAEPAAASGNGAVDAPGAPASGSGSEAATNADGQAGVDGESGAASGIITGGIEGSVDTGDLGSGSPGEGAPPRPPYDYAATVENTGADCLVAELPAAGALTTRLDTLPDPFSKLDGTPLTQASEWRCRRQEIREQAEKYIYGEKPPKPEIVTGTVATDTVSVDVTENGTSIHFDAQVVLPPGTGPFPAIINLGVRGPNGGTTLGEDFLLQQGVAVIYYNHYDLGQEGMPEASRGLPNPGLFYDIYGGDHSAGLLMAWAWGASRLMDVLQASEAGIIDPERVGVTGCSRNGKGAFTVGVFDERIALTIPQETSTGGLPAYRIVDVLPGAERTNYNYFGLNWLSNVFEPFVENAPLLPVDSHEMVAMVAPRGLLVLDNPHIAQFAATAAHTAVLAGAEVYRALGALDNVSYISDVVNDVHCASGKPEYTEPLTQSIARFLKHEAGGPATIRAGALGTGDLSQWKTWQTPTLTPAN